MGRYFLSGRSPEGRRETHRVGAPSARRAVDELTSRGFSDVSLISSEFQATPGGKTGQLELPAQDEAKMAFHGTWFAGWVVLKGVWMVWVPAVAFLVYRAASSRSFGVWDIVAAATVLFSLAAGLWAARAAAPYNRMLRAMAGGRWEEGLRRAEVLKRHRRIGRQIPPSELDFHRSVALLRLGRGAEAEQALAEARGDTSRPDWLLELRSADFWIAGRELERARQCYERAVELAPRMAETHLSLAQFLAAHLRDTRGAGAALERALAFPIAESVRWAVLQVQGILHLEEGDAVGAKSTLQQARAEFQRLTDPGFGPVVSAYLGAFLCQAHAALGETQEAEREYQAAVPWLAPHGLEDLLKRCRRASRGG
jgi:tetratricopeptide (TPR) repeat protein